MKEVIQSHKLSLMGFFFQTDMNSIIICVVFLTIIIII